jgi:DNA polymerase III delta prime subunit
MKILPNHHAIFASGEESKAIAFFREGLVERKVNLEGNPDIIEVHYDSLGIKEARELVEISLSAPIKEKKKIIILSFKSITREAQNALLKLFEDPNPSSEFLITGANVDALLPTLRSRLFVIRLDSKSESNTDIKKFLSLSIGEKLKEVEKLQKQYKDDGDKGIIVEFLKSLHQELLKNPKVNASALRASAKSLSCIDDKSSSVKILLESVILSL